MKFEKNDDGTYLLDVTGYVCPHLQLYTLKCMEKLNEGMVMEVLIDNPSSIESVTQACNGKGYEILDSSQPKAGVTALKIRK